MRVGNLVQYIYETANCTTYETTFGLEIWHLSNNAFVLRDIRITAHIVGKG